MMEDEQSSEQSTNRYLSTHKHNMNKRTSSTTLEQRRSPPKLPRHSYDARRLPRPTQKAFTIITSLSVDNGNRLSRSTSDAAVTNTMTFPARPQCDDADNTKGCSCDDTTVDVNSQSNMPRQSHESLTMLTMSVSSTTAAVTTVDHPPVQPSSEIEAAQSSTSALGITTIITSVQLRNQHSEHKLGGITPMVKQEKITNILCDTEGKDERKEEKDADPSITSLLVGISSHPTSPLDQFRRAQSKRALQRGIHTVPTTPCSICFENMTNDVSSENRLLLLSCGHCCCSSCCKIIASNPSSVKIQRKYGSVECPFCRLFGDPVNKITATEQLDEIDSVVIEKDGTFEICVNDKKQGSQFMISCCWDTSVDDILDLLAPLRVYEFPGCDETMVCPREKLRFGVKVKDLFAVLSGNTTLAQMAYNNNYLFIVGEHRITAPHSLITARLERFAQDKVCPDGNFNVRLVDFLKYRPNILIKNVNRTTTLLEIVCLLKEKVRTSGVDNADVYSSQDKKYMVFGRKEKAFWNLKETTLGDLHCQGYERWKRSDGGVLYYE